MNAVEPIRDKKKIEAIKRILKSENIRNYLLFTLGINTGLRISDLLQLKVEDVVDEKGEIREFLSIREKKTGKEKKFVLNKVARNAIEEFMQDNQGVFPGQYLFASRKGKNQPITRIQAWEILNKAKRKLGIQERIGTHTLRKTFGYHAYKQGIDITLLQKIFNHSAPSITLRYIGITQDNIDEVYNTLNL
ncbi:MAG: site-specific integrase [Syntrophomonadaceae bacterium]|nr:site-specific integrase [Syntrophomonadaceae bacterium]